MERISKAQAQREGFKALTNYYGKSYDEQAMLKAVIWDQLTHATEFALVINPLDAGETAVWRKGIKRYAEFKREHACHIILKKKAIP